MANKSLRMDVIERIIELHSKGVRYKRIGRILGISKNTVKKYVRRIEPVANFHELATVEQKAIVCGARRAEDREAILEDKLPGIIKELGKKGVTRLLLWQEYKEEHPDGFSYGRFCERIQRARAVRDATIRIRHDAGHCLMVDFAGKKVKWVDKRTAEELSGEVLVCTFPSSGYTFACAVRSQRQEDFIEALNEALLYFGGVPRVLMSDNLKSFVVRSDRYEPTFTELCVQFSAHYGIELQAARVARPKDYVYKNIM